MERPGQALKFPVLVGAPRRWAGLALEAAILALAYILAARAGNLFLLSEAITPVWPAAGVSLAALVFRGERAFWGITLGAVIDPWLAQVDWNWSVSVAVGLGNGFAALLSARVFNRVIGEPSNLLKSSRGVVAFATVCAPLGSVVAASVGVGSLWHGGYLAGEAVLSTWITWWAGDMQGYLGAGVVLLTWLGLPRPKWSRRRFAEACVLSSSLIATSLAVFSTSYPMAYAPIPFLIWASLRFRQHGATAAILILSGITLIQTSRGYGPFVVWQGTELQMNISLILLQAYLAFIALMTYLVTATVLEREATNDRLVAVTSQKQRMESELRVGHDIQMSMLPLIFPPFPDLKEFSVFATLQPAREVGGDFYDFFFVDDERLCICIGDVSGKGVPAALFMAVTRTLIKSTAKNNPSPASILSHVNDELSEDNETCMFVTAFLAVLNVRSGEFLYTNAGHNPPYVKRAGGSTERLATRHGTVLGALGGQVYKEDRLRLSKEDLVLMYTDGVTEAMNLQHELFSEHKLAELMASRPLASVEEAVNLVVEEVKSFEAGTAQADDVTVLAVVFHGLEDSHSSKSLDLTIPNRLTEIGRVQDRFNDFATKAAVPKELKRRINLVLDELLNNVISYAYDDELEHEIDVKVSLSVDRLVVTIEDVGIPFNPFASEPPDTTLSLEEREIGGLGTHLVPNLVDEVNYQRRTEKNVVTVVKRLSGETSV